MRRLSKFLEFLGPRVITYLFTSLVVGILLFAVEVGFSYGMQAFLLLLGVADRGALSIPRWLPHENPKLVLLFIFAITLMRGLLYWAQEFLRNAAAEIFSYAQRSRMLKWAFYGEPASTAAITALFGERSLQASHAMRFLQMVIMQSALTFFLGLALFYISPTITLAASVVMLVFVLPIRKMNKYVRDSGRGLLKEWDLTNNRLMLSLKNLLLLRIYGLERAEERLTQKSLEQYLVHYLNFQRSRGLLLVIPQAIGVTLVCTVVFFARSHLGISTGNMLSYFYLFIRFLQNAALTGTAIANANFLRPQIMALYDWWLTQPKAHAREARHSQASKPEPLASAVGWTCKDVSFRYPGSESPVLNALSLDIKPGSALVITGPSGVGKSTLIGLLLGELIPTSGNIELELNSRTEALAGQKERLLPGVGYVGAESFLIDGTILENLLYGVHTSPSREEIDDAIRKAECQFVADLPRGLEHRLTEQGQGLSAGQKQRLALARALLRRPKALILDEATANLDFDTEQKLVSTFSQLKGQMTIVAVTHRQALLGIADQVIRLGIQ